MFFSILSALVLRSRVAAIVALVWAGTIGQTACTLAAEKDLCPDHVGTGSLMRTVDLKLGQEAKVTLADGQTVVVKLLAMDDCRDKVRRVVRSANVVVSVNGKQATLDVANYHLPITVDNVQIDCPVTAAYRTDSGQPAIWALDADARLRLWPAKSGFMPVGAMVYPVEQRWFATATQMCNEPADDDFLNKTKKIYYHYGLDIGGADQRAHVVAATDGQVVSVSGKFLEGEKRPALVVPRYDVVFLRDAQGWYYRYSHLDSVAPGLKLGDHVKMGQRIGVLGKQGSSGGWSHLHWGVTAPQPSGHDGNVDAYVFLWEAYRRQWQPKLQAVARPHQLATVGDRVTLDGRASWSSRGVSHIARYEWQLSDGTTAVGPTVSHRYDRPGKYSEILKISDAEGNVAYDFADIRVVDPAHLDQQAPRLHAAYHPTTQLKAGDPVTFLVRSFCVRPGDKANEIWDFGDGSPTVNVRSEACDAVSISAAQKTSKTGYAVTVHRFEHPGRYLVSVHRTNDHGETGWVRLQVLVEPR